MAELVWKVWRDAAYRDGCGFYFDMVALGPVSAGYRYRSFPK